MSTPRRNAGRGVAAGLSPTGRIHHIPTLHTYPLTSNCHRSLHFHNSRTTCRHHSNEENPTTTRSSCEYLYLLLPSLQSSFFHGIVNATASPQRVRLDGLTGHSRQLLVGMSDAAILGKFSHWRPRIQNALGGCLCVEFGQEMLCRISCQYWSDGHQNQ